MKIYNSMDKKEEEFNTIEKDRIILYVCGLTPYDNAHLGHARTYVSFDIMKRYWMKKGYEIYHIQNITDIEDKIIKRAEESKKDPIKLAEEFQKKADKDFKKLNIIPANVYPKASEHIPEIIQMIEKIIQNGYGYESKDGVYFNVSKFQDYGKLSGQKIDSIKKGARIKINENKKNAEDFTLWKKENGLLVFESPWGKGRPGWHIECSAMSMKYSKNRTLDVHGGGKDLSFPHHENEIAQTEAALGIPFSKYWVHTGFLTVNKEKMSKSLGNFIIIQEVLENYSKNAIRLFFALTHYRSPVDYSEKEMLASEKTIERIFQAYKKLKQTKSNENGEKMDYFENEIQNFYEYMDNDFDTPQALAQFFNLIKKINTSTEGNGIEKNAVEYLLKEFENILWIIGLEQEKEEIDGEKMEQIKKLAEDLNNQGAEIIQKKNAEEILEQIVQYREKLRKEKQFEKSDEIRDKLKKIGIGIEDKK